MGRSLIPCGLLKRPARDNGSSRAVGPTARENGLFPDLFARAGRPSARKGAFRPARKGCFCSSGSPSHGDLG